VNSLRRQLVVLSHPPLKSNFVVLIQLLKKRLGEPAWAFLNTILGNPDQTTPQRPQRHYTFCLPTNNELQPLLPPLTLTLTLHHLIAYMISNVNLNSSANLSSSAVNAMNAMNVNAENANAENATLLLVHLVWKKVAFTKQVPL
jgi:hypothetical protein